MRTWSHRSSLISGILLAVVLALASVVIHDLPAQAAPAVGHDKIPSAVPAQTPAVNDGKVFAITKVGNTVIVGGSFSNVNSVGGAAQTRNKIFAFNASTGAISSSFVPTINGDVNDLVPGPVPGTVFVGGSFSQVNNSAARNVTLLNVSTGQVVGNFRAAAFNGAVNSLVYQGNRLYVGGNFTTVGGVAHGGLAALNPTTGAVDNFVGNDVAQRHNDSGSGAQGAVGVRDIDVTADGSRLVAIGNFKRVDGLDRDQVVMVSLTGAASSVTADWQTNRYKPYCFNWAFDTYVRGVSFSPDGSYFVVAATGGQNAGTLCDTAARFETMATGTDIQPTWINYSGGDTLWAVTATEKAVFVGGHQRWMNNSLASDYAGPGAVPRPGLAALNVETGMPLKWNPGRNPRGAAVYALHATPDGLWLGSDTEYIGNRYQYKRPRLAFFPLASGAPEASDATANLPGTAYASGESAGSNGNVLYRVNAGGPTVGAVDSGPDWAADDGSDSPYRNSGSNGAGWSPGATTDGTVPASTPNAVFDSERWSPSDDPAMKWAFPVQSGLPLKVRLFFANRCSCTNTQGSRQFDVRVEGNLVLDNLDLIAPPLQDQMGTMREYSITSDGMVNIDFSHEVENPLINAIEIVRTDVPPPTGSTSSLRAIPVTTSGAGTATTVNDSGIDWTVVRGSFLAGGKLYYGKSNGTFNSRTMQNGAFGAEQNIDPYNDPDWADVSTGSGGTFLGARASLYSQFSSVTGMAYADGRLYYTLTGNSNLYWRWFNADSGTIGADTFTANGGRNWSDTGGMFIAGGRLYFVTRSNGNLNSIAMTGTTPSGPSVVIDGPSTGGNNWRGRAVFLDGAATPPPNPAPTADFTSSCTELACQFDGSGSNDDGSIASYDWEFGDGATATGQVAGHTFAGPGTYTVRLTVTDDDGASDEVTRSVAVSSTPVESDIDFIASGTSNSNRIDPSVDVPAGVQVGDTLVLAASLNAADIINPPAGWTLVSDEQTAGLESAVWTRSATAADLGGSVTITMGARHKVSLILAAYRGVDATSPVERFAVSTDASTAQHTTPLTTASGGNWVLSYWAEKSPETSSWSTPGTVVKRADVYSTGGGRVSGLLADSGAPVSGVVAGVTASTDATSSRSINWSIVLRAAQ